MVEQGRPQGERPSHRRSVPTSGSVVWEGRSPCGHPGPHLSLKLTLVETTIAKSPLREMSGTEEILTFNFRVLPLWMLDARQYVAEHAVSMYTLLPMMAHIDANMLLQAIDELIEYCKGNDSKLARRLLWLNVFLRRAETLPLVEKTRVEERLEMFDELLEQDEFVQKQRARAEKEGEVKRARKILISYISIRYPSLLNLAQQKAEKITQEALLQNIIDRIFAANDEATVRSILSTSSSAA